METNNLLERITVNPNIQHGKPCIKGTRTPVYIILEGLALDMTAQELKNEYLISDEDIKACISFAALLANEEEIPFTTAA
ncbi:MAG: DUF433 domain-containing protein [Candidatus Omnitrophota bacterium]